MKKNSRKLILYLLIGGIIGAIWSFSSCKRKEQEEIVKIGVINSLTGSAGVYGQNAQNGILMAQEEINAKGGINNKKLLIITEDDKTDPKVAVSAFNKLVEVDRVKVIIGPLSSSSLKACAPLANRKKILILSPGAADPELSNAGPFIFRNRSSGKLEAQVLAKFAFEKLHLRNVAILYIKTAYGVGFKDSFKEFFEKIGGKIVYENSFVQSESDFRTYISNLKRITMDGLYLVGVPKEAGLFLKQAYEMDFKTVVLMNNMESQEFLEIAGKAAEGVYFSIPYFDLKSPEQRVRNFVENYKKKYGKIPDLFAANGYDAVYILSTAIKEVGVDPVKIRQLLLTRKFPAVNGGILSFDKNGDVIKKVVVKTVKNGKFVIVQK